MPVLNFNKAIVLTVHLIIRNYIYTYMCVCLQRVPLLILVRETFRHINSLHQPEYAVTSAVLRNMSKQITSICTVRTCRPVAYFLVEEVLFSYFQQLCTLIISSRFEKPLLVVECTSYGT